jgi:hypothetical protein
MPGGTDKVARRKLIVAILLVFIFLLVELGGMIDLQITLIY